MKVIDLNLTLTDRVYHDGRFCRVNVYVDEIRGIVHQVDIQGGLYRSAKPTKVASYGKWRAMED